MAYSFATWLVALAAINVGHHFSSLLPSIPTRLLRRSITNANINEKSNAENGSVPPGPMGDHEHSDSVASSATAMPNGDDSHPTPTRPAGIVPLVLPPRIRQNPLTGSTPIPDLCFIASALISYLVTLLLYFLGPHSWRHRAIFPMLLSPPGAILRFALGRLNVRPVFIDRFPIGTFIANMLGTLVLCASYVGERLGGVGATRCNAFWGIQQGFCGCLSTVSTFVVEARAIPRKRWKWVYEGGSVILGHLFALAIVGGVRWNRGLEGACTGS